MYEEVPNVTYVMKQMYVHLFFIWQILWVNKFLNLNIVPSFHTFQDSIVQEGGYPWEEYKVTTEDGYINSIYRIPYSQKVKSNNNARRLPVILGHGLTASSAVFVNQCSLAYYLADEGFDVWLPNNRGTTYSRGHVYLDPEKDKEKYWSFSWHEIGTYDMPAFVDFVIEHTGFKKVFYIGHSQGTTAYAVFASERPEYNEKIILSCLLGIAIPTNTNALESYRVKFLLHLFVPFFEIIDEYIMRLHECPLLSIMRASGCIFGGKYIFRKCALACFYSVCGNANDQQIAEMQIDKFCQTTPDASAFRQVRHFRQNVMKRNFAKYDYGPEKNIEKYGCTKPPLYDLSKMTAPVALFYGNNDMYNNYRKDMLDNQMSNVVHIHIVEDGNFNHIDFLTAKDRISLLYEPMVKVMRKYEAS